MREIKFRGQAIESIEDICRKKEIVIGNLIIDGVQPFIVGKIIENGKDYLAHEWWVPVEISTIGQYTGLKDKNGKEIYEGDIVNTVHRIPAVQKYYSKMEVFFDAINGDWKCGPEHQNASLYSGLFQHGDNLEVIGNIYENPKLLTNN